MIKDVRGVFASKPEKLNNFFCFVLQSTLFHNFSPHSSPSALYTFCSAHTTAGKRRQTLFGDGSGDPNPGSIEAVGGSHLPIQCLLHMGEQEEACLYQFW